MPKLLCTALTGKCYATLKTSSNKAFHLLQNRFCKGRNYSYLNFSFSRVQTKLLSSSCLKFGADPEVPAAATLLPSLPARSELPQPLLSSAPAHSGTSAELCLMSINTGFSIPAKPSAWGCGTNPVPVSLAEQIFHDGYSMHTVSASSSSHNIAVLALTSQNQPSRIRIQRNLHTPDCIHRRHGPV